LNIRKDYKKPPDLSHLVPVLEEYEKQNQSNHIQSYSFLPGPSIVESPSMDSQMRENLDADASRQLNKVSQSMADINLFDNSTPPDNEVQLIDNKTPASDFRTIPTQLEPVNEYGNNHRNPRNIRNNSIQGKVVSKLRSPN
jgi:hypothetical protein